MVVPILFALSFVNLLLGLFVFIKDPDNRINISFSIVILSLTFWLFTWPVTFIAATYEAKLFWTKMMLAGPSITPPAFLYFSIIFPHGKVKVRKLWLFLLFVLPAVFFLSFVPTDLYIKDVS